ncbi:MAG: NADH-quinone oxidoreductase subunit N [Isosphaeraceae bacterium]|nr:NADH-quinone oxidoreductase subunit N [Isosphaeraceae bacterium]
MPVNAVPMLRFADFLYLAPEIVLTAWGLIVLMVDFGPMRRSPGPRRRMVLGWLTLAGAVLTLATVLIDVPGWRPSESEVADPVLFFNTIAGDRATFWMNLLVALLLAVVVGVSMAWEFTEHWGEYYALLCWAAVAMMLLVASEELLTLFLTLETMTLCLYVATAFEKARRRSAEGGLKYFVYGSVSSALFLFGLSLIYGLTGSTRLEAIHFALSGPNATVPVGLAGNVAGAMAVLLVLVGFGFKIAAVPFHQWAPDAYEGAPAPVTAWIASGSKVASFVALLKVLVFALGPWARKTEIISPGWIGIVAAIAAVSMTFGNFAALAQRNFKRMLAYSSIAHSGYILVGVLAASVSTRHDAAAGSVLFYLVIYSVTTVGAFALAAWLARDLGRDDIDDLNGLGYRSPGLAACIVVLMLSLIGMPPLAGFFGKLYMFMEALRAPEVSRLTLLGLVALGLLNSVVSAFYYVRVLKAMFLRPPGERAVAAAPAGIYWPIVLATGVAVVFGLYPAPLLDQMKLAAAPMLQPSMVSAASTTGQAVPPSTLPAPHGEGAGEPSEATRPAVSPPPSPSERSASGL